MIYSHEQETSQLEFYLSNIRPHTKVTHCARTTEQEEKAVCLCLFMPIRENDRHGVAIRYFIFENRIEYDSRIVIDQWGEQWRKHRIEYMGHLISSVLANHALIIEKIRECIKL